MPLRKLTYNEDALIDAILQGRTTKQIASDNKWTVRRTYHVFEIIKKKHEVYTMMQLVVKLKCK